MTISRALARPLSRPLNRNLYSSTSSFDPATLLVGFDAGVQIDPRNTLSTSIYAPVIIKEAGVITQNLALDDILAVSTNTPTRVINEAGDYVFAPHNYYGLSAAPVTKNVTVVSGRKYTIKTTGDISLVATNAATGTASPGSPLQITAGGATLTLTKSGTAGTAQVHEGHGEVGYIETPTSSSRWGVPVSKHPDTGEMCILTEPNSTNYLINSHAPATQSVSLAAGTYMVSCQGTGSIALSGGPTGTVDENTPISFVLGGTTSVTFTVTGALDWFQCENGANTTSPIVTEASARGRSVGSISLTLADVPALGAEWLTFYECIAEGASATNAYIFAVDDTTTSNYFRMRSDGLLTELVAGVSQFSTLVRLPPVTGSLFSVVIRSKDQEVVFASNGGPSSNTGNKVVSVFTPTRVTLGTWLTQPTPGQVFTTRFSIQPAP